MSSVEQPADGLGAVHGALALPVNLNRLALDDSPRVAEQMIRAMIE